MYYELLQQRYGVGINKQAGIVDKGIQWLGRIGGKGIRDIGRIGGKASTQAATNIGKQYNVGPKAFRKYINLKAAKDPATLRPRAQSLINQFNKHRDDIAYTLGRKRLLGAGALGAAGLTGYGAHSMFGGDDASTGSTTSDTATSNQVQTPNMSDAQLMAQNGWNGWNWDDLGGSLTNYITSGKIAEHAIPAVLAYIAGRAMS